MFANVSLDASHVQKHCHCETGPRLQNLVDNKNNTGILLRESYARLCVHVCVCVCVGERVCHIRLQG